MTNLSSYRFFVTGGAGFIGTRLVRQLTAFDAARVVALDNLHPQVHGSEPEIRNWPAAAELVSGDIRDRQLLEASLRETEPDIIVHLAAETGTGQSIDQPAHYCDVNITGTANLLEAMRRSGITAKRMVLASSRAIYGEGPFRRSDNTLIVPPPRSRQDMENGVFDPLDGDGRPMTGVPVMEDTPPAPCSVYGSSKLMQEYLVQQVVDPGCDWAILRFQNVYGPGQSLRNPYTGVLSIFCQQILAGGSLNIFEDGEIVRDFVFVDDVVRSIVLASTQAAASGQVVNIGSGQRQTIAAVARVILRELGAGEDRQSISGDFRPGDIRHALADISRARDLLGWKPETDLAEGLRRLVASAREEFEAGRASGNPA